MVYLRVVVVGRIVEVVGGRVVVSLPPATGKGVGVTFAASIPLMVHKNRQENEIFVEKSIEYIH